MEDEFALRRDMAAAAQVQSLLESEHGQDIFAQMKATYIAAWEATGPRDKEGRDEAWRFVKVVDKFKGHLETIAANGRLAERQIAEITARPKRFGIV